MSGTEAILVLPSLSSSGLPWLLTKAVIILVLGTLLASDLGMSSAAVRHRAHFATLLCLVMLPLMCLVAPQWTLPVLPVHTPGAAVTALLQLALLAYLAIAALKAARLAADILQLAWATVAAVPAGDEWQSTLQGMLAPRRLRLLASAHVTSPLTWGFLHPVILVPRETRLSAAERRMVLQHELGHIQRGDWLAHLLGRIVAVLYWPIPGLRQALAQHALESEQACDNHVLAASHPAPAYASLLLAQARRSRLRAAVTLSRQSELAQRIRTVCSPVIDHSVISTGWPWLVPLCLVLTLPLAGMAPGARPPDEAVTAGQSTVLRRQVTPAPGEQPVPTQRPARIPLAERAPGLSIEINREDYRLAAKRGTPAGTPIPEDVVTAFGEDLRLAIPDQLRDSPATDRPP